MKKTLPALWLALWIFCLLAVGLYEGLFAKRDVEYSLRENRMLAGFPEATAVTLAGGSFMENLEGYFLDHFPGRGHAIRFAQGLRDHVSFAGYADYLAIAQADDDPLAGSLDALSADPSAPALPPAPSVTAPPDSRLPALSSANPGVAPEPVDAAPRMPDFPTKPEASADDFPRSMGVYMQADSRRTALRSYERSRIIEFAGVLNRFADLLPPGGALSITMVPQSSLANRFAGTAGREALYSDMEPCLYAFTRDNVFVTSTTVLLGQAIMREDYVYFRTDMHWTPYGTHIVYSDMVSALGHAPTPYEDFEMSVEAPFLGTYYRDNPTGYMRNNADELELIKPGFPCEFLRVTAPGETVSMPLLDDNAKVNDRYTVYLGGPAGPWSILRGDTGRTENCLVLTDSFGLAFVSMLAGQYKEVHYYDPRYFNAAKAGGSVSELIELYGIRDIFVVVGDLHSFNSDFIYQAAAQL